tara:strand:- start:352 stop:798 length:447 start_codon:yes stop_codon:yes gene_type:complete
VAEAILNNFEDSFAPVEQEVVKKKNPGRSHAHVVEARRQRLYKRQLEGHTTRQLVLDHASKEGVCTKTAWNDWTAVNQWNEEDWQKDRENMLSRLQSMRVRLFNQAVKKGQLQTAAQILDSLGKVIGESVETVNINAPELAIRVESKE